MSEIIVQMNEEIIKGKIRELVRGSDLLSSTPRQLWLQQQLGLPRPEYGHVPLLLAPDGRRLAKRDRDQELGQLRQQYTARELVGLLAHAAGLIPEPAPSPPKTCCPCSAGRRYRKRICSCGSEHSQNARTDWSGVIRK